MPKDPVRGRVLRLVRRTAGHFGYRGGIVTERRWHRSRDAVAGGICAGAADVLGVDAVVIRILVVLLCLMTAGLGVAVYFVLWALVPLAPEEPLPLDVRPHKATSETYGVIDVAAGGDSAKAPAVSAKEDVAARRDVYMAAGHVPPQPPLGVHAAAAAVASQIAAGIAPADDFQSVSPPVVEPPSAVETTVPGSPSVKSTKRPKLSPVSRSLLLWACLAVAFVALLRLLGFIVQGASWWRFWPLFFVLSGIAVMAVPGKRGLRMAHAITGWFFVVAGSVVLPMSVGLVSWASLASWVAALWPLAAFAVAFLVVAWLRCSWPWALAAGILFSIFCLVGLLLFAEPGSVPSIVFDLPLGRDVEVVYPFG